MVREGVAFADTYIDRIVWLGALLNAFLLPPRCAIHEETSHARMNAFVPTASRRLPG